MALHCIKYNELGNQTLRVKIDDDVLEMIFEDFRCYSEFEIDKIEYLDENQSKEILEIIDKCIKSYRIMIEKVK